MADIGYVKTQLGAIADPTIKQVLGSVFEYVLGNLRHGVPADKSRATNFQAYFRTSTSASSTNEFAVAHRLDHQPKFAQVVMDTTLPGATAIPIQITRAADANFIYLKVPAGFTNTRFTLLVE